MAGLADTDIRLDDTWALTQAANGDAPVVSGLDCFLQDIRLEAISQEGELFYDTAWGWSLVEFIQRPVDEMLKLEIAQRVKNKLAQRGEIDAKSIQTKISSDGDTLHVSVKFSFRGSDDEQDLELALDRVTVEVLNLD